MPGLGAGWSREPGREPRALGSGTGQGHTDTLCPEPPSPAGWVPATTAHGYFVMVQWRLFVKKTWEKPGNEDRTLPVRATTCARSPCQGNLRQGGCSHVALGGNPPGDPPWCCCQWPLGTLRGAGGPQGEKGDPRGGVPERSRGGPREEQEGFERSRGDLRGAGGPRGEKGDPRGGDPEGSRGTPRGAGGTQRNRGDPEEQEGPRGTGGTQGEQGGPSQVRFFSERSTVCTAWQASPSHRCLPGESPWAASGHGSAVLPGPALLRAEGSVGEAGTEPVPGQLAGPPATGSPAQSHAQSPNGISVDPPAPALSQEVSRRAWGAPRRLHCLPSEPGRSSGLAASRRPEEQGEEPPQDPTVLAGHQVTGRLHCVLGGVPALGLQPQGPCVPVPRPADLGPWTPCEGCRSL